MKETLNKDTVKYLVGRLLDNANDAVEESNQNKDDAFYQGRRLAYYEMLDILKTELDIRDQDLKEFGLDIDLENRIA